MARYVREIMSRNLVTAEPDDSIVAALKIMRSKGIHSVLIPPPRGGRLWRIFTYSDFLLACDSGKDPNSIPVAEYASSVIHTVHLDWTVEKARSEMVDNGVKHLPVKDGNGNIVGIISIADIINDIVERG